jgi:hypothetical protein
VDGERVYERRNVTRNSHHQDPCMHAENSAQGAFESCVAQRKWKRVDVSMTECAPCDACKRQRAKEEVELLEKGSRWRRAGWWGGTERRACRWCASIVARIRMLAQHQRNATVPAGIVREGVPIADG